METPRGDAILAILDRGGAGTGDIMSVKYVCLPPLSERGLR